MKIGHFESFFGLPLSEALSETLSTVAQLQGLNAHSSKAQSLREGAGTGSCAQELSASWGRPHAIVEHDCRASESIVLNIAEGSRLWSGPDQARSLDYAIGSALECAACL
ncbi:MAG TPA: four helix bundle protein, partial [Verrucomicrobiae bacterium]|nr:four helix bundle protein [Verrucomicrobiae bacterium]